MKYYEDENKIFKKERRLIVKTQSDVKKIVNKLCRHFKLPSLYVFFKKRHPNTGEYYRKWRSTPAYILFHKETKYNPSIVSIHIVCHEVGHHWDRIKNNPKKAHTKKHMVLMKRLLRYCEKMDCWGMVEPWTKQVKFIAGKPFEFTLCPRCDSWIMTDHIDPETGDHANCSLDFDLLGMEVRASGIKVVL